MTSKHEIEQQARETYHRFVAVRDQIDSGNKSWSELADFFTADAVYIDPAWGRQESREVIRQFFNDSMAGLTGYGWSSPERWIMVDGHRVVSQWDQVLGKKTDGSEWIVPGLSILYYAGDGLFCYSHDYLNMTHIGETLKSMAWQPPAEFNMPPAKPDWSTALPAAWQHLSSAFK
ncbi:nuclear transport factor 2 family protein [Oceanicoccus sp. KOV_DT_Chl]|uniref:nuclear transport factor 2 family protein n=1 Tax=Oceanicoccus sp. KOV_DT_Chl TaxID=1904639 RepID=UPI00135C2CF8|nr:nuclear transport factor 2 family protein [Oceanicoccus sp. KOV_DT_Chl]